MNVFERLKKGLEHTRQGWGQKIRALIGNRKWDSESLSVMEEFLISADVGIKTTELILGRLRLRNGGERNALEVQLQDEILGLLSEPSARPQVRKRFGERPWVIMFVGVNGVGKTTTIGKFAAQQRKEGRKVLLAAADTFRAAAIEQLEIWGQRTESEVIRHLPGQDPSGVVFDALQSARKREADLVLIDTAGRLHTKTNLMEELKKMRRIIGREIPTAPHETLLVLDASTGQNGIRQAKVFDDSLEVTGIVLTKLDGTAKGGVVLGIQQELGIPVQYIGVGEEVDDLQPFDPARFVEALFS